MGLQGTSQAEKDEASSELFSPLNAVWEPYPTEQRCTLSRAISLPQLNLPGNIPHRDTERYVREACFHGDSKR